MKKILFACLLASGIAVGAMAQVQSQTAPYNIADRGLNYRVWAQTNYTTDADGETQTNIQSYTELATGMSHTNVNGGLTYSTSEISILPNNAGAAATNCQHSCYWPPDAEDSQGSIQLYTPDNQWIKSVVIGLSFYDSSSGQSAMIAELTNSTGEVADNTVTYPNAFSGLSADLVYKNTLAGLEQDVVLDECPPSPSDYSMNPETTYLEVVTEFLQCPQPAITGDSNDMTALDFGTMIMGPGNAFLVGGQGPTNSVETHVQKNWSVVDGQNLLFESVPWSAVESQLTNLPAPPQVSQAGPSLKRLLASRRMLPRAAKRTHKPMKVARHPVNTSGYVLDYVLLNSTLTNYTFRCDSTYYISGLVTLSGTSNVWEGGSVIKFANTNSASISISSANNSINHTGSYLPVILTAQDDNSVGTAISGSTGLPTNYYANPALSINSVMNLSHLRISYANTAVKLAFLSGTATISDSQFVNCDAGITMNGVGTAATVQNSLFSGVYYDSELTPGTLTAINDTFVNSQYWTYDGNPLELPTFYLTNCIFANVTNLYFISTTFNGDFNGFYRCKEFGSGTVSNTFYPFEAAGAGDYYLTNDCDFLEEGTTNIGAALLADLAAKTTYPPLLLSNQTVSADTTLSPQAQRDNGGTVDLGYHYDPIDWITDDYDITNNAQLDLTNGVAIACYNDTGILLTAGCGISSVGTPLYPNWIVQYQSVQEQPISLDGTGGGNYEILPSHSTNAAPSGLFSFTKFAAPAGLGNLMYHSTAPFNYTNLTVQECEFWGGGVNFTGCSNSTATLNNNLFYQTDFTVASPLGPNNSLSLSNNLLEGIGNKIQMVQPSTSTWNAFNNVFDTCWFGTSVTATNGYNGYINCTNRINPVFGGDVILSNVFAWQTGPLGNFYQATNSSITNAGAFFEKGSTNANLVGLFHYTVLTNEPSIVESNNFVSIGYHYVGVNASGSPLDSNGDGIPDYLEDANGNGKADSGEINWQDATDRV